MRKSWGWLAGTTAGCFLLLTCVPRGQGGKESSWTPTLSSGPSVRAEALFTAGKEVFTTEDMKWLMKVFPGSEQFLLNEARFKEFINAIAEQMILEHEAVVTGIADEPEIRMRLRLQRFQILARAYVQQKLKEAKMDDPANIPITEEEVKQYYEQHQDEFTPPVEVRISHILLSSEEEAKEVLGKLKKGGKFADLAKKYSRDPTTKNNGGELKGWQTRQTRGLTSLVDAVLPLKVGQVSDVVKSPFGFHIIKLLEKKEGKTATYEEVKSRIQRRLQSEKQEEFIENLVKKILEKNPVVINDTAVRKMMESASLPAPMPPPGPPETPPSGK